MRRIVSALHIVNLVTADAMTRSSRITVSTRPPLAVVAPDEAIAPPLTDAPIAAPVALESPPAPSVSVAPPASRTRSKRTTRRDDEPLPLDGPWAFRPSVLAHLAGWRAAQNPRQKRPQDSQHSARGDA